MGCGCNKSIRKASNVKKVQPTRNRTERVISAIKRNNSGKVIRRILERY